jgi:mannose-6-phosphate isomerase-like protein (cupin superfamily)
MGNIGLMDAVIPGLAGFPGATSVSRLSVYDWPTIDGLAGGSPHLHTASTEGYVVLGGHGAVQTLSGDGYAVHALAEGDLVWFTPGTVHRLVNDGELDILVVMQNAGLPEAGDVVLTFPPPVLADPEAYARAATLPPADSGEAALTAAARGRRDLAIEGYLSLVDRVRAEGPSALRGLYEAAARLVADRTAGWTTRWRDGVAAQATATEAQLAALAVGDGGHLRTSAVRRREAAAPPRRYGMCGRLQVWDQ